MFTLRTVKGQECEGKLDAGKDAKKKEVEHAERLERLDSLLSGTNRRRRCATIARDLRTSGWGSVAITLLFRALHVGGPLASRLGQRDREENGFRHEQDEREDRRCGIDVELGAA